MANVRMIPPTVARESAQTAVARRRVAAYARVSTDNEEQLTSYEAQVDYYTRYIQSRPDWNFVKVYTDEGVTGVNTRHRDGFNEMIADALDGKIDLIVTKSVSRFARNTVDSLVTIRKLKEKNVEVYFEKECIYSLDGKGELLLTIMSSLAQEESRSLSENIRWGHRKRMADGKVSLPYSNFLGYTKGEDGLPKIVDSDAITVRFIYEQFLQGKTPAAIANTLTKKHIPTPGGKQKWASSTIQSILTNEKYKGDALLQKSYTVDYLTKKKKLNEGEIPQYYIEDSHEAIIPRETFDLVQHEMKKRKESGGRYSGVHVFSGRLVCGECGSYYGAKLWHSTDKYRRTVYQCNQKFKNERRCTTPHVYETKLKEAFVVAFNELTHDRDELMREYTEILAVMTETTAMESRLTDLVLEREMIVREVERYVGQNAVSAMSQDDYNRRYNELSERYTSIKNEHDELSKELDETRVKGERLREFMAEVSSRDGILTEFDEQLWYATIETVTIEASDKLIFRFRNGEEIEGKY